MLTKEEKKEILDNARTRFKEQLTQRIIDRAHSENANRIETFIAQAIDELNRDFKEMMPL